MRGAPGSPDFHRAARGLTSLAQRRNSGWGSQPSGFPFQLSLQGRFTLRVHFPWSTSQASPVPGKTGGRRSRAAGSCVTICYPSFIMNSERHSRWMRSNRMTPGEPPGSRVGWAGVARAATVDGRPFAVERPRRAACGTAARDSRRPRGGRGPRGPAADDPRDISKPRHQSVRQQPGSGRRGLVRAARGRSRPGPLPGRGDSGGVPERRVRRPPVRRGHRRDHLAGRERPGLAAARRRCHRDRHRVRRRRGVRLRGAAAPMVAPGAVYYLITADGILAALVIIAATFPVLARITGPEVARNE